MSFNLADFMDSVSSLGEGVNKSDLKAKGDRVGKFVEAAAKQVELVKSNKWEDFQWCKKRGDGKVVVSLKYGTFKLNTPMGTEQFLAGDAEAAITFLEACMNCARQGGFDEQFDKLDADFGKKKK